MNDRKIIGKTDEIIVQLMEMIVDHEKRLTLLEEEAFDVSEVYEEKT
jgi:hypothetical protein